MRVWPVNDGCVTNTKKVESYYSTWFNLYERIRRGNPFLHQAVRFGHCCCWRFQSYNHPLPFAKNPGFSSRCLFILGSHIQWVYVFPVTYIRDYTSIYSFVYDSYVSVLLTMSTYDILSVVFSLFLLHEWYDDAFFICSPTWFPLNIFFPSGLPRTATRQRICRRIQTLGTWSSSLNASYKYGLYTYIYIHI